VIEDVVTTMKTILTTYLGTEVTKQDTHANDGITIGTVSNLQLGNANPSELGLPAVVLQPMGMTVELYCTQKKDVTHEIHIGVAVTDTVEDNAFKKLWRLMRAVENCLEIHAPGTSPILDFKVIGMEYLSKVFSIDDNKVPEKTGIITARVLERLDAYNTSQI
jgi:hypothetical protein